MTAKTTTSTGQICLQEQSTEQQWHLELSRRYSLTRVMTHITLPHNACCCCFKQAQCWFGLLCRSGQSRGFGSGSQPQVDVLGRLQHRLDRDLQPGRQWEADSVWHRAGEPPGHHSCLLHWVIPYSISVSGLLVWCVFLKHTRAHTLFKTVSSLSCCIWASTRLMSKMETCGFQAPWNPTWSTSDRLWVNQAWIKFICVLRVIFKAVLVETAF